MLDILLNSKIFYLILIILIMSIINIILAKKSLHQGDF